MKLLPALWQSCDACGYFYNGSCVTSQFPSTKNQSHVILKSSAGMGISPFLHTQNYLSLTVGMFHGPSGRLVSPSSHQLSWEHLLISWCWLFVDGDLYSAAPLDSKGSALQFRRKAGRRQNVWMYDRWVSGWHKIFLILMNSHQGCMIEEEIRANLI